MKPVGAARPLDAARPVDALSPVDAVRLVHAAKTDNALNHLPPSPTPIPLLDGDAPEQDDPGLDNPGPDLNCDLDTDHNPDDDHEFCSINCKKRE